MNLEVFCYLGLLRFPEQLEPSLSLLPDDLRDSATTLLASLKDLSKAELVQRWAALRGDEYVAMRKGIRGHFGISLEDLPPSLRLWCASWWAEQNG